MRQSVNPVGRSRFGKTTLSIGLLLAFSVGSLGLSACGSAVPPQSSGAVEPPQSGTDVEPPQSSSSEGPLIDLSGTWVAVDVPEDAPKGLADTEITVSGDVGGVSVNCNDISFLIEATRSKVEISDMAMTQMLCEQVAEAEDLVTEGLTTPGSTAIVGTDRMVVQLSNGLKLNLERVGGVPDKLAEIAGTWHTASVAGNYEVLSWWPVDDPMPGLGQGELTITGNTFVLTVGCNHFRGTADDGGPNVILGRGFSVTQMYCPDLQEAEDLLARSLSSGITVRVLGDSIYLALADKMMLEMSREGSDGVKQSGAS